MIRAERAVYDEHCLENLSRIAARPTYVVDRDLEAPLVCGGEAGTRQLATSTELRYPQRLALCNTPVGAGAHNPVRSSTCK